MPPEDFDHDREALPGVEMKGGPKALADYAGKIVALSAGEVRAFGATWAECFAAVKRAGLAFDSVEFMSVPSAVIVG